MDKGFYHPNRGYWQVNDYKPPVEPAPFEDEEGNIVTPERPHHFTDDYPDGAYEVPLKPKANCEWEAGAGVWVEIQVSFDRQAVAYEAEELIASGTQINGIQFKTDLESVNRLREILDCFNAGFPEASAVKAVTFAGVLLELNNRQDVEALYHAAIRYRAGIVTRSAEIQQLDPIPDPSNAALWT